MTAVQAPCPSAPPLDPSHSIPARLAELAAFDPQALALAGSAHRWSRARLQTESVRVARALLREAGGDTPVALLFEHDAPLVAAILGTLLAGRSFAVIDAGFPDARNRSILDGLGAGILLADRAHAGKAAALNGPLRRLMMFESLPALPEAALPGLGASPDTPLGVFHTTGTTGAPKGILWHQSMCLRRALTDRDDEPIRDGDRHALVTALCFPAAISDLFNALLNGASLHLYDSRRFGPTWLADWLRQEAIGRLRAPVALFRHIAGALPAGARLDTVRLVGLTGDALGRQDVLLARRVLDADARIFHRYSMSESGMIAREAIEPDSPLDDERIPAGRVAPGKTVRILDESGQLVAPGEFGEICLRLEGCAAGYWEEARLVPLPSIADPLDSSGRLYRSGDIGRLRADGRLELAGRRDARVKIRGYRVETPAVERALRTLPCVGDAAVAVHPDAAGENALVGFVVLRGEASVEDIRSALGAVLPAYMVPSSFVPLDALPLAANGKLDRKALRPPGYAAPRAEAAAPAGDTGRMCRIFAEVLGRDVGPADDFFALGGHSLLAARVLARVATEFGRRLSLSAFYLTPTAAGLAAAVDADEASISLTHEALEPIRLRALHDLGWL